MFRSEATAEEKNAVLEKLKAVPEFAQVDDHTIARFAQARDFSFDKAASMLSKHLEWHANTFPLSGKWLEEELETKKFFHSGFDKDGHPVLVFWGARHKTDRYHGSSRQETVQAIAHVIESVHTMYDKQKFVLIIYAGKGTPTDKALVREFSQVMSDNYPEKLHKAIIYPGTKLAHTIWAVTKWFFHRNTREKVLIMPTSKSRAHDVFRSLIPVKSLHKAFGGEREDDCTGL